MADLSSELGKLFIFGFEGKTIPPYLESLIEEGNLGGVILFERNGETPDDFRRLTSEIKNGTPSQPLIFIDQEGGRITRIRFNSDYHKSAEELSALGDKDNFRRSASKVIGDLKSCGIDVNTVPVLDIPSKDNIPVLRGRCYGDNPEDVIRYSSILMDAYNSGGMLCCAKHFPGLGDVKADPHYDLPVDDTPITRYYNYKLLPFIAAIKRSVPIIMTTHILSKALDDKNPATLSTKIVDDLLKKELGFDGAVMTDDLEMGGITENYSWEEIIIGAIRAGNHLLLICQSKHRQLEAIRILKGTVERDAEIRHKVEMAIEKITALKRDFFIRTNAD